MPHLQDCDRLAVEASRFADVVDGADLSVLVPSCPGWALGELASHLGHVHRWAEELVQARAQQRLGWPELVPPPDVAGWIRQGARQLVSTLRAAPPDQPMWAWGTDQHVRFWSRRQLHETLVHRMDAELALGREPEAEPAVAADAVDEFLENLAPAVRFSPRVANLRGNDERLLLQADDVCRAWAVSLGPDGFQVDGSGTGPGNPADAALRGLALELLLVLYRRRPLAGSALSVSGRRGLVDFWLENSALE